MKQLLPAIILLMIGLVICVSDRPHDVRVDELLRSHSQGGFSPVAEAVPLILLTVLTVWSAPMDDPQKKTVKTVPTLELA